MVIFYHFKPQYFDASMIIAIWQDNRGSSLPYTFKFVLKIQW